LICSATRLWEWPSGLAGIPFRSLERQPSDRAPQLNIKEITMALLEQVRDTQAAGKIVYTAKVHTIGGRENGEARSSDGQLDVKLSVPGTSRPGTNPEQLFAAGWSACFEGAIAIVAQRRKIKLSGLAIDCRGQPACDQR
jgi:hypothetical protein